MSVRIAMVAREFAPLAQSGDMGQSTTGAGVRARYADLHVSLRERTQSAAAITSISSSNSGNAKERTSTIVSAG